MWAVLFWVYLANAVLLINHEIDSAFWREWELFRLLGGATGFLLLHFPLLALILLGLVQVHRQTISGLILSYILGFGGLFAFFIHSHFLRRGRGEFRTPISRAILLATLLASLVQAAVTTALLLQSRDRMLQQSKGRPPQ